MCKMLQLRIISLAICLHALIGATHGADKYTDENRPYEFGFKIDGEQHRHEKKDENGIIMGEFGFITADGVYHVTVYATDENGRFKILSMKNIRVKPYPTAGGGVKKGHSIPFPPSENAPTLQGPSKTSSLHQETKSEQTNKQTSLPVKSCSHCSLPTTTTKAPQLTDIAVVAKDRPVFSGGTDSQINQKNIPSSISSGQRHFGQQETLEQNYPTTGSVNSQQSGQTGLGLEHSTPLYKQPNSGQQLYGNQQNYAQQEHNLDQNYQQHDSSGKSNLSPIDNSNYFQQNTDAHTNNPQGSDGSQHYQNGNVPNQNGPSMGNSHSQAYDQNINSGNQFYPQEKNYGNQNYPQTNTDAIQKSPQQVTQTNNNYAQPGAPFDQNVRELSDDISQTSQGNLRTPKQYSDYNPSNTGFIESPGFQAALASQGNQPIPNKPSLLAAQMQIVPKNTDIYQRSPGENEGLPNGLSKNDMTQLLYTFNYTVGFHGHHEEGYTNGAKQGYYFVTGRNGVRTRVDYIADEKGFRPRISQEVLDLASDDVPKPETEKDEKFGLKGYEFKWLYYPADAKK